MMFFWFFFHRMPVHLKLDFSFWIPIFSCIPYSTLYIHLPFLQSSCVQPPSHCLVLLLTLAFTVHHTDFNSITVFGIPTSLLLFNLLFILVYIVSSICHLHLINFMISYIFYQSIECIFISSAVGDKSFSPYPYENHDPLLSPASSHYLIKARAEWENHPQGS